MRASVWRVWRTNGTNSRGRPKISWEKAVEDWRRSKDVLGEAVEDWMRAKCLESGRRQRTGPKRSWEKERQVSGEWDEQQRKAKDILGEGCGGLDEGDVWESVSGEWDEQQRKAKDILGEGCGGLDEGKCLESGTNSRRRPKISWEKAVEDWMRASVCGGLDEGKCLESGTNSRGRPKISWEKAVEDWMRASVWGVGRIAEEGQRDLGRRMWRTG